MCPTRLTAERAKPFTSIGLSLIFIAGGESSQKPLKSPVCNILPRIPVRQVGHTPDKLLCEQRRNRYRLPLTTEGKWVDHQCRCRGSEIVIVDGVTTIRGERERRSQGEGSHTLNATRYSVTDGQAAVP